MLRSLLVRRRMLMALVVGLAGALLVPSSHSAVTRGLLGWNIGVWLYLALVIQMMVRADEGHLRRLAVARADGAFVVLSVEVLAALVSVAAIVVELSMAKGSGSRAALPHLLLALCTVAGSWLLLPTLFTLNYAGIYYRQEQGAGLAFPGAAPDFEPDYGDFAYFAFTIAVAAQTADVAVTDRTMRRLVLVQSVLAFVFNTTVLALTINIAAGLF